MNREAAGAIAEALGVIAIFIGQALQIYRGVKAEKGAFLVVFGEHGFV